MKLFAKYNRLNLVLMVGIFILTSIGYYFLLRYVLIEELDEDLLEKKQKIEQYVIIKNSLPVFDNLDDINVFYAPALSNNNRTVIRQITHFGKEGKRQRFFRQLEYDQLVGNAAYRVSIIKPIEGIQSLFRAITSITLLTILLI